MIYVCNVGVASVARLTQKMNSYRMNQESRSGNVMIVIKRFPLVVIVVKYIVAPLSSSSTLVSVVGTMIMIDCPPPIVVVVGKSLLSWDGAAVGNLINRLGVGLILAGGAVVVVSPVVGWFSGSNTTTGASVGMAKAL